MGIEIGLPVLILYKETWKLNFKIKRCHQTTITSLIKINLTGQRFQTFKGKTIIGNIPALHINEVSGTPIPFIFS